jgi:hypothetical protein
VGKFAWTAIGVLVAAFVADQYWNYGYYTDAHSPCCATSSIPLGGKTALGSSLNSLIFPGGGLY